MVNSDKLDSRPIAHTIREAVRASGISRSALYLAIGRGALRARKCGARTLILDSDLRRFLRKLPPFATGESKRNPAVRSGSGTVRSPLLAPRG
jgi:hypothetical protein